ncbi:hypothetical protein BJ165DRAFT_1457932 [Panaeolus papilionaceus]|nr:hypothetical protein BJ165DRAFT_1457932 [Panaeolus papilionaceus]
MRLDTARIVLFPHTNVFALPPSHVSLLPLFHVVPSPSPRPALSSVCPRSAVPASVEHSLLLRGVPPPRLWTHPDHQCISLRIPANQKTLSQMSPRIP